MKIRAKSSTSVAGSSTAQVATLSQACWRAGIVGSPLFNFTRRTGQTILGSADTSARRSSRNICRSTARAGKRESRFKAPVTPLVASQTKLALQKKRRDPTLIGGHQISSPEPDRQGDLGVMKDCLRRHRNLVPTAGALPAFQFHQFISTLVAASRTHKPIRPAAGGQVFLTSLFTGELRLKFAQGFRKRRARHPLHYSLWSAETTG